MALNINPANFSGTAAVAGRGISNAAITVPGALGLEAVKLNLTDRELEQRKMLELAQLQQQAQIANGAQGIQRQAMNLQAQQQQQSGLFDQQRLGMQNDQFAQELALKQAQMGQEMGLNQQKLGMQAALGAEENEIKKQAIFQKQQQAEMKALMEEKKETIKEKGAFASYARLAMDSAKTPEEAQQLRTEILNEAVSKGHISEEEAKMAAKSPISTFKNMLGYKILQYGAVKNYKDMQPEKEKGGKAGSLSVIQHADGSTEISSTPTTPVTTEAQKDIKNNDLALQQLDKVKDGYDPSYFTYRGQANLSTSQLAEKSKGIPGLEQGSEMLANVLTGKSPEERAKFLEKRSSYMNNIEQVFNAYKKEITGAAAGKDEIEMLRKSFLNGDMSPSELQGSLSQIVSKYKAESDYNKQILNKGINTSPSQLDATRNYYKNELGWSDEQIDSKLRSKGYLK